MILTDDTIDFSYYLSETDAAEKVKPAIEYLNGVMHQIAPAFDEPKNPCLPFMNCDVQFAPGEVTAWGGFNNSGKSMLQGQIMGGFADEGQAVCIASFEMKPVKTLARIARQMTGFRQPTRDQVKSYFDKNAETLYLYDQQGTVRPDRIIAVVKHCAEVLKCKHIAIDSLMKCVKGTDDYNGQKDFVNALTVAARDYNVHAHLVVHLKKGDGDERMPTRMDISGTAAISDLVDNVLLIWRNKKKERDIDSGKDVDPAHPDAVLICDKQRNGDWEGRVRLYYDRQTMRYTDQVRRGLASHL